MSLHLVVPDELSGQRLDIVVARLAPSVSRRQARRLVDEGGVFVDGKRIQVCSRLVRAGARLEVVVDATVAREAAAEPTILSIDPSLVVVDKAAGVPTEPTRESARGTLRTALDEAMKARGEDVRFLHAVHRLDTHTTGVVIFARTADAAHQVGRQLHDGIAERRYLALIAGTPTFTTARFDWALAKGRDAEGRVRVDRDGSPALTLTTVLAVGARGALALCNPRTGRTHQLRVHLAEAGHPLVGDRVYGGVRAPHIGLHALSLSIIHPDGHAVRYAAPPPEAFLATAEELGLARAVVLDAARHLTEAAGEAAAAEPVPDP